MNRKMVHITRGNGFLELSQEWGLKNGAQARFTLVNLRGMLAMGLE
jgi:hypothetical protein